jgi:hypothetical protein
MANILTPLYKFVLGNWAGGLKTICRSGPIDRNSRPWKERKGKSDTSIDRDNIWQAFLAVLSNAIKKKLLFRSFFECASVIFGPRSKCLKKKWFFHDEGFLSIDKVSISSGATAEKKPTAVRRPPRIFYPLSNAEILSLSRFRWTEHDIFFKVSSFCQDVLHTCYNWVILGLSSWYLNIYKEVDFDVNKTPSAGFTADEIRGISETKSEMWWVDAIGANQFFFWRLSTSTSYLLKCV